MGILARAVAAETKGAGGVYERWLELMDLSGRSKAGPAVTRDTIFKVSASLACMREISQGLAQVPFKLMQDYEEGGLARKRVAREHPLYDLLAAKPNGWQTAFEFMETLGLHACLGNAYVYKGIYRNKVAELMLLNPAQVRAEQKADWSIVYKVRGRDGGEVEIPRDRMWHVRGPSWDGFLGMDTLQLAKEALGLSLALEESHASLHANGVRPSGVYTVEGNLTEPQHDMLTGWLKKQAAAGTGTPLVLDRSAKWVSQVMSGVDAQHIETRKWQFEEVCRYFGVLPSVLGYTGDKANTYASAEVMENAHKVRTLGRWYKRIQDSANVNLLTDDERTKERYYTKFVSNGLMAASAQDRAEFYGKALGSGGSQPYMTADEVRALEDLDPMGGDAAKLQQPPNKPAPPATP